MDKSNEKFVIKLPKKLRITAKKKKSVKKE